MTPTLQLFTRALLTPDLSFKTLADARAATGADGLPRLDEVKLITYDLEWAGKNRTRLISYFDTHIYSARTLT